MINPDTVVVDVEEQREWLLAHHDAKGISWGQLSPLTDVGATTLSAFANGSYAGNSANIAQKVFRYRQTLASQESRQIGLVSGPGFFETRSTARLKGLMTIAHGGRITLAAMSPGTSKTVTAQDYAASASNVWLITMRKEIRTPSAMTMLVLRALGVPVKGGWGAQMGELVIDRVRQRRGLMLVDEANHLSIDQFEVLRGWHDASGVGMCFLGNEELMARIESGQRSDAFARLHSRIASSHVQTLPLIEDVQAFCDAWGITDGQMRDLLGRIALTPAAGGLRECAQIVEQASMIAADESRPLSFADLREAKATRATRNIH